MSISDPYRTEGARYRLARALSDAAEAGSMPGARRGDIWQDESQADEELLAPHDPELESSSQGVVARLGATAFDPGRPGVRVLAGVAAAVVLVAAAVAWWSRPRPEPVVPQLAAAATPAAAQQATPTAPAEVVVAVTGKVQQPGLVRLSAGARIADALEAAGGPLPGADLDYLNLARKVSDGELIAVGIPAPPPEQAGAAVAGQPTAKINLNTATQAELETLPGVGPALAQRILDFRATNGAFEVVSQLRQVSGIGDTRYAELHDRVTV